MTEIGVSGLGPVLVVGQCGQLGPIGGPVLVEWWIGADDRWHTASSEAAVRQQLDDDGVSVQTRLRIPGGDAVQRATAVPDGGKAVGLVEIENSSPVPVALALVVRAEGRLSVIDDTIFVDDYPVVRASRTVARMFVADTHSALFEGVTGGAALPPPELDQPIAGGAVAAIFPLPHTATLQYAVAIEPAANLSAPAQLPARDAVARGWDLHVENAATVSVPDPRVASVAESARRHLLIGSGSPQVGAYWQEGVDPWMAPVCAAALDAWGHGAEGRELLLATGGSDDLATHAMRHTSAAGALMWAWAERLERMADPELEAALSPWLEEVAISLLHRRRSVLSRRVSTDEEGWRAVGLASAGSLLSRSGNETLGPDIMDALPELVSQASLDPTSVAVVLGGRRIGVEDGSPIHDLLADVLGAGGTTLSALAGSASTTGAIAWSGRTQHPMASALFLLGLRRALVDEPEGAGGVVALLAHPEDAWLGAPIEGHGLRVAGGSVSFGVRWHGERPALLWDVQAPLSDSGVCAPGLDDGWSDERQSGEALLGPTEGLTLADGPESPNVGRGRTIDPKDTPDSFG